MNVHGGDVVGTSLTAAMTGDIVGSHSGVIDVLIGSSES